MTFEFLMKFRSIDVFQSVDMDPCLDDCIEMSKKLKRLGVPIGLDVLPGLPHGFLSFVKVNSMTRNLNVSFNISH